jgi:diadenylate cyclase
MEAIKELIVSMGTSFKTMGVLDVADILIVAYLLYKLFSLLRHTNAVQVVKGIVLLIVIAGLAGLLNLHVLSFILNNTLQQGFLALVIVFQPELRKMLEQVGRSKLPFVFGREPMSKTALEAAILQTVEACSALSVARVGALIIFERETRLSDVIKTGTMLDAQVSGELLKNIFYPKAPLHDGAVIVREGRLAGAGCMLPMSANINLSRDLGMRHRAGVGISENSDAVAVIVSEETGSISVAVGGMLKRHLAPQTLEKLLSNELSPVREESRKPGFFSFLDIFKVKNHD